jgi:hypothetical protein
MKALPLPAVTRAMCALLALAAGAAGAEARGDPNGQQVSPPPPRQHMHPFAFPLFVVEPQVIVEREVVHDAAPAAPPVPAEPPPPPRKPYVLGRSYDRLPGGCMKMIERGTSYFQCSGEWYRQVGGGSAGPYIAVARP